MDKLLATIDSLRSPGSSVSRGGSRTLGSLRSPGSTASINGSTLLSAATSGGERVEDVTNPGTSGDVSSQELGFRASQKEHRITRVELGDPRCFGFIGQSKICLAQKGECKVARHRKERGSFAEGTILILSSPLQAFKEPTFESSLESNSWDRIKELRLPVSGWTEKLKAENDHVELGTTLDELAAIEDNHDLDFSFNTPGKEKLDAEDDLSGTKATMPIYSGSVLAEDRDEALYQDGLGRVVLALDDGLEATSKALVKIYERVDGLQELESTVLTTSSMMDTRFDDLAEAVGRRPVLSDNKLLTSTLWGSISSLAEVFRQSIEESSLPKDSVTSSELKNHLDVLSQTLKVHWLADIRSAVGGPDSNRARLKELESNTINAFKRVTSALKDLVARVKVVEKGGSQSLGGTWDDLIDDPGTKPLDHVALKHQVELLMARIAELEAAKVDSTVGGYMEEKVALLEDKVQKLILDGDDTSIRFMSLGFKGLNDTIAFVNAAGLCEFFGLFMDPLRLLAMMAPKGQGKEAIKLANESRKINITNGMDAGAVMCLKAVRPVVLHEGEVIHSPGPGESPLNKLPTHSKWESGSDGWKHYMEREIQKLEKTVTASIERNLKGGSPAAIKAKSMAELALAKTVAFLLQLSQFISKIYDDAHKKAGFAADRSWSLTMRLFDRILADLYVPRAELFEELVFDNKVDVAAKLLYAVLQTQDRMEDFTKHNIRDHPSISSEYVKFLTSNSGADAAQLLEKRVKALEDGSKVATEAKKKADTAANKASECSDKVTKLLNRLDKAETKIKTLEKNQKE